MLPADAFMRRVYGADQDDPNPSSPWGREYRDLFGGPLDGLLLDGPGGAMSSWSAVLC